MSLMFIKEYLSTIVHSFWFLWVLFGCYFITSFGKNYIKKGFYPYLIVIFILLLLLPDKLNLNYLKFMYPYFIIGYFYKKLYNSFFRISELKLCILGVIFIILYICWEKDYYIYTTGMYLRNPYPMGTIIIYRYLSGLIGSLVFINIIHRIKFINNENILSNIGQHTLGIYILQSYIMDFINKINMQFNNMTIYTFIITPILACLITYICIKLLNWISKFSPIKQVLFG